MANNDSSAEACVSFLHNGVAQIALVVPDLDRAIEMYWKRFGVGPWHIYTYQRPLLKEMSYRGRPTDYAMRLALSFIGSLRIELIEVLRGETVYADFVREHGYGLHHLGVLVEDMNEALAQARAAGLEMIQDGAGFGRDGDGRFAYLDTEKLIGTTLELIERPKARIPPERIYPAPEIEENDSFD
ncbi:MAG: VOC family protein [Chloroflexi bacterium]|nr:VOC family protein [Chloroflexota bacterium]